MSRKLKEYEDIAEKEVFNLTWVDFAIELEGIKDLGDDFESTPLFKIMTLAEGVNVKEKLSHLWKKERWIKDSFFYGLTPKMRSMLSLENPGKRRNFRQGLDPNIPELSFSMSDPTSKSKRTSRSSDPEKKSSSDRELKKSKRDRSRSKSRDQRSRSRDKSQRSKSRDQSQRSESRDKSQKSKSRDQSQKSKSRDESQRSRSSATKNKVQESQRSTSSSDLDKVLRPKTQDASKNKWSDNVMENLTSEEEEAKEETETEEEEEAEVPIQNVPHRQVLTSQQLAKYKSRYNQKMASMSKRKQDAALPKPMIPESKWIELKQHAAEIFESGNNSEDASKAKRLIERMQYELTQRDPEDPNNRLRKWNLPSNINESEPAFRFLKKYVPSYKEYLNLTADTT